MPKSVYIHIPFCKNICSYCDFCKIYYDEKYASLYIKALEKEIIDRYKKEKIETVYIGGGTPSSLSFNNIVQLFDILKVFNLSNLKEFTFEFNISDIEEEKLKYLKDNKVNRISIGIETINKDGQKLLDRVISKKEISSKINLAKKYFDNINLDIIYAYKDETIDILKEDLDFITSFNPSHVSCYSLILEEHTILNNMNIEPIDEELDNEMYYYIKSYLENIGYNHIEISNYARDGYLPIHNLVYWNNEEYYGFGVGASGYTFGVRYDNTKSITAYIKGDYLLKEEILSVETKMDNELMLGLRKIKGINVEEFFKKYGVNIQEAYNLENAIKEEELIYEDGYLYVNPEYIYVMNEILINIL
jgi:oxygen-independent coproporphyrinogen-3 oxidase